MGVLVELEITCLNWPEDHSSNSWPTCMVWTNNLDSPHLRNPKIIDKEIIFGRMASSKKSEDSDLLSVEILTSYV